MKTTIDGISIQVLFSRNLKRLRGQANLSQVQLASSANLTHNFINDIENGKKWVSAETIAKLSIALRAEPYQFFLSGAMWHDDVAEMVSTYLDELETTQANMVDDCRRRLLPGGYDDMEQKAPPSRQQSDDTKAKDN